MKVHTVRGAGCMKMAWYLPACGVEHILEYAGHMGMGVVQRHDPHEHAGTLSSYGSIKVLEDSIIVLCADSDIRTQ